MSTGAVLAIDQGTSATKAVLLDGGLVLAVAEIPVRPTYAADAVEVDPEELWDSVVAAADRAVREAGSPALAVVALANQGETVLAWDPATGRPLSRAIGWQDRRAASVCRDLADHGPMLAQRTGLVLDPYFTAPKLAWLRRQGVTGGVVTTTDAWLVHRLTGELVTDVTTASRSLLVDVDSLSWDPELLEVFGWSEERLPRIVANDEVVGQTRLLGRSAAGGPVPVGGLVVDQQAALAAQRCLSPGDAKCTYGTGAFLLANTGLTAVRSENGLSTSAAWVTAQERAYCLDGQVFTAGSALRWLTSVGLLTAPEALDAQAAQDSDGVTFVPGLAGVAAPWWDSRPSGAFLGMGLATERGSLVRAAVEGLVCQVADLVRLVGQESGTHRTSLRVDGGLTRSAVLMQAQADLLQVPVECYPSPHATALGAAALARMAVTPGLTLADAVTPWEPVRTYDPQWSADRADSLMDRWRRAVDAVLTWQASADQTGTP